MNRTDSEPLNRLAEIINNNAHLMNQDDVKELQEVYNELVNEYILFEAEVEYNEQLLMENEKLKSAVRI